MSSPLGICFAIEYRQRTPQCVRAIWGRIGAGWEKIDLNTTSKYNTQRPADRTAAIFAWLVLSDTTKLDKLPGTPAKITEHLKFRAAKLLNCSTGVEFLSLRCFFSSPQEVKDIRESEHRSEHHPFFCQWFTVRKDGINRVATADAEIMFCDAKAGIDAIERQLKTGALARRITSPGELHRVIEILGTPEAVPSQEVTRPPERPAWVKSYLQWATTYPDLQPPTSLIHVTVTPWKAEELGRDGALQEGERGHEETALTALQALNSSAPCTVLLGNPGSGKTSTLRARFQELRRAAEENADAPLPIFVDLTDAESPMENLVLAAIGPRLGRKPQSVGDIDKRLILLFDGLDRCSPKPSPAQLTREILGLAQEKLVQQVVLTCTTSLWSDAYLGGATASVYEIQPLDIRPDRNAERYLRLRIRKHAKRIMRIIRRPTSRLAEIVHHPLYLSLLCDYLSDKEADAPFPDISGQLIHTWIQDQLANDHGGWFQEGGADSLAAIASLMVKRGTQAIRTDDVRHAKEVVIHPGWQQTLDKACFCRLLSSSAHPGRAELISFPNQYFRDYFAAVWLKAKFAEGKHEEVFELLRDTAWDRPFITAVQTGVDVPTLSHVMDRLIETDLTLFRKAVESGPFPVWMDVSRWVSKLRALAKTHILPYEACQALCGLDQDVAAASIRECSRGADDWQFLSWSIVGKLSENHQIALLEEFTQSKDKHLKEFAMATLVEYMPEHRPGLIEDCATSHRSLLFNAAIRGLRKLGSKEATDLLAKTLSRLLESKPPQLTEDLIAKIFAEGRVELPATFRTPAQTRNLNIQLYNARSVTQAILDIATPAACDTLDRLLSNPKYGSVVALLIARCDEHLLFHVRLKAVQAGFLRGSSGASKTGESAEFIRRDMETLAVRHDESIGGHSGVSHDIARAVTDILASTPPDELWEKASADDDREEFTKELWYFVQRSRFCGPEIVAEDWEYLWELTSDPKCDAILSYDILHVLARIDPSRTLTCLKEMLALHDPQSVASCISDAAELVNEVPIALADELCLLCKKVEANSAIFLKEPFAKLPKTEQQAQILIRLFIICPYEKTRHLLNSNVLWPHQGIVAHLRKWLARERKAEVKEDIAACLSLLGDACGLMELVKRLPTWVRQAVAWERVAIKRDSRIYNRMIWHLRQLPSMSKGPDSRLAEVLAHVLGILEEKECKQLVDKAKTKLTAEERAELFRQVRDVAKTRYFDLL